MREKYHLIGPVKDAETADAGAMMALAHPIRLQMIAAIGPRGTTGDRLRARFRPIPADQWAWHMMMLRRNYLVTRERATLQDLRSYTYRLNLEAFAAIADRLSDPRGHLPTGAPPSHA